MCSHISLFIWYSDPNVWIYIHILLQFFFRSWDARFISANGLKWGDVRYTLITRGCCFWRCSRVLNTPQHKPQVSLTSSLKRSLVNKQDLHTTPIKKHRQDVCSIKRALPTPKRSNPCICGCGIDCATDYINPFPPDTPGRVKMLKMFSLDEKLSRESFWGLVGTKVLNYQYILLDRVSYNYKQLVLRQGNHF